MEVRGDGSGPVLAIGLMSGTSMDGIDVALIETDGEGAVRPIAFLTEPYADADRRLLFDAAARALEAEAPGPEPLIDRAAAHLTALHADAVRRLLAEADLPCSGVGVVGFHGQTIAHRPDRGWTWQIGDGARLAADLAIPVVSDFRSADVAAGGQGAPLLPVYHRALAAALDRPVAILNLGGIGNLTWIGADGELVAFDTGPANALVDDWVALQTGARFDEGGALAGAGSVHASVLDMLLDSPYFDLSAPKSLDRGDFSIAPARGLSVADGAATLTAFSAQAVALSLDLLPARPRRLLAAGGGRHNPVLMRMLGKACVMPVEPIEAVGWNGDATEAEGFAYMAVRTLRGLPISFPGTTGIAHPLQGGRVDLPRTHAAD